MNKMLSVTLSKVLTSIINNSHMNENLKYQLMSMSYDLCTNLAENNKFILKRLDELEKKVNKLEECKLKTK